MPEELKTEPIHRSIARFMLGCAPLEQHLMEGHALSDTEAESIATTITGLQTAFIVWKHKNGRPVEYSCFQAIDVARRSAGKRRRKTDPQ